MMSKSEHPSTSKTMVHRLLEEFQWAETKFLCAVREARKLLPPETAEEIVVTPQVPDWAQIWSKQNKMQGVLKTTALRESKELHSSNSSESYHQPCGEHLSRWATEPYYVLNELKLVELGFEVLDSCLKALLKVISRTNLYRIY